MSAFHSRPRRIASASVLRTLAILAALAAFPLGARAQTGLERGEERLAAADFAGAVEAFEAAEANDTLDRDQLVRLYARRSLAHLALGAQPAMEADLRKLASLAPAYEFGLEARPEIHQAFERLASEQGRPLRVSAEAEQAPGSVRVVAEVSGDTAQLTRRVRVAARTEAGQWQTEDDGELVLPVTTGRVEYYAAAVGPGGATLAAAGSEDAPLDLTVGAGASSGAGGTPHLPPAEDDDSGGSAWIWIGIGAAVALGVIVAVVLLAGGSGESDVTQPDPPAIFD